MSSRQCPRCKRHWPARTLFQACPICFASTNYLNEGFAMSAQERDHTLALLISFDAELEDATLEAARRGPSWTVADVLLEQE